MAESPRRIPGWCAFARGAVGFGDLVGGAVQCAKAGIFRVSDDQRGRTPPAFAGAVDPCVGGLLSTARRCSGERGQIAMDTRRATTNHAALVAEQRIDAGACYTEVGHSACISGDPFFAGDAFVAPGGTGGKESRYLVLLVAARRSVFGHPLLWVRAIGLVGIGSGGGHARATLGGA